MGMLSEQLFKNRRPPMLLLQCCQELSIQEWSSDNFLMRKLSENAHLSSANFVTRMLPQSDF